MDCAASSESAYCMSGWSDELRVNVELLLPLLTCTIETCCLLTENEWTRSNTAGPWPLDSFGLCASGAKLVEDVVAGAGPVFQITKNKKLQIQFGLKLVTLLLPCSFIIAGRSGTLGLDFSVSNLVRSTGVGGWNPPNMETALGWGVGLPSKVDCLLVLGFLISMTSSSLDFGGVAYAFATCLTEPWRFSSPSIASNPIGAGALDWDWLDKAARSIKGFNDGRGASVGFFSGCAKVESRLLSGPVGGRTGLLSETTNRSGRTEPVVSLMLFFSSLSGVLTCGDVFTEGEEEEWLWPGGSGAGLFFLRETGLGLSAFAGLQIDLLLHTLKKRKPFAQV